MPYLFILVGLLLLMVGGHFLVVSSVGIALRYKVSTLVIGLTLVSFATSAPELLVSLMAAYHGFPDIAIGNVFGSNIANTGLILGLTSFLFVLPVSLKIYFKDWLFLVAVTVLLFIVGYSDNTIYWYEGMILFAVLVYYNVDKIRGSRKNNAIANDEIDTTAAGKPMYKLIGILLLGIIGLKFGADLLVLGAVDVATTYGISERVVSLSMVALGTSLPELVASIVAARKGEKDLAIGNILGSNIFNILGVLGITSMVQKIVPSEESWLFDYWWVLGFTLILYPLMRFFSKKEMGKKEGAILVIGYVVYIVLIYTRN